MAVCELTYALPLLQLLSLAGRELRESDGMTLLSQAARGDGKTKHAHGRGKQDLQKEEGLSAKGRPRR